MHFAYMDEAGNTGRRCDDPAQPIHMILTAAVDETKVSRLHEHVRDSGRLHLPSSCNDDNFEFHGQNLFSGRGCFGDLSPSRRIEIYDDVLRGLEIADAEVIIKGVEKTGLADRYTNPYHPHDIALMFTIESVERMARANDCHVLLVADEAKKRGRGRSAARPCELPRAWNLMGLEH